MASLKNPDKLPTSIIINTNILNLASYSVTIKLTVKNYLLYKAQMVHFLQGNQLFGLLDGSLPKPPLQLIINPNPKFTQWNMLDQLVLYALNSSLSESSLA